MKSGFGGNKMLDKQNIFSGLAAKLILKAQEMGYLVSLGEAWRTSETAAAYKRQGKGIQNSNHCVRLAIDLNLFKNNALLTTTQEYEPLGVWWEAQTTPEYTCCWGGRFADADHFSLENDGVK